MREHPPALHSRNPEREEIDYAPPRNQAKEAGAGIYAYLRLVCRRSAYFFFEVFLATFRTSFTGGNVPATLAAGTAFSG